MSPRRVVVIGAGTAGICSAKTVRDFGLDVVVYEQSDRIGGTWNYTDRVGPDEFGLNYGYMYQGLVTNVPKEIMGFSDLNISEEKQSFLTQEDVLDFLKHYVDHFKVEKDIKFRHEVIRINPIREDRWEVIVRDVVKNEYKTEEYDFVMVCTGHHWDPRYPHFKGEDLFKGSLKHSYTFRRKEEYQGQKVCVVGSASSSVDVAIMLSDVCSEVIYAQHYPYTDGVKFPKNIRLVVDVEELSETGVILKDGSTHDVDAIIYCTGFYYTFPFLTPDCGVFVEDNHVQPLYKQLININYPTMSFIGLNYHLCIQLVMDLQARFCLKYWSTNKQWPSKEEMRAEEKEDLEKRLAKGWKKRHAHRLWDMHGEYNDDLAQTAEIPGIEPVYLGIYFEAMGNLRKDYQNYRKDEYRILDKERFLKIVYTETGTEERVMKYQGYGDKSC